MMKDPRPICRACRRRWAPPEGVYANATFCQVCCRDRQADADGAFKAANKRLVVVVGYGIRVSKDV